MKYFVFRNNTVEPFFPAKDYDFSGYGDISLIPQDSDGFVWFYQLPLLADASSLAAEVEGYCQKLQFVVERLPKEKTIVALTLHNTFAFRIEEGDKRLDIAVGDYNRLLFDLTEEYKNFKVLDLIEFTSRYSLAELTDWKFWYMSQMSLNPKLVKPFMAWWENKMRGLMMKRKKCLILDLDNTLWGGILGEDGVDGIKLGGDYPGKAFLWWQKAIKDLADSGVILAVCSKNNEADVLDAWHKHPEMKLTEKAFSAWRINWQDKATNIQELAHELNIGLDSFVFVDDNPTERELVRQMLPMVEVPDFPTQPYRLPELYQLLVENYFQVYSITAEDKKKTAQYKANADRAKARKSFSNFEDFLQSLEMKITIEALNDFNLPRIAQMTQKTNQFNLTTRRYTESDIHDFKARGWKIWCISVADKFGDNGITGCIMVDDKNHVDTFLLSCRILGKGIERAFLKAIFNLLKDGGVSELTAEYLPTAKNAQVADFYEKVGFSLTAEKDGAKSYALKLADADCNIESYYDINIK